MTRHFNQNMWIETVIITVLILKIFFKKFKKSNVFKKIPSFRQNIFCWDNNPIQILKRVSTIIFVDFNDNINFLKNLPDKEEDCYFVLVATAKNYKMLMNINSLNKYYPQTKRFHERIVYLKS